MFTNDSAQEKSTAQRPLPKTCPRCDERVSMITVTDPEYMRVWPCGHRIPV
ncbi:hypothetical protein [Haladaptatus paucihalophilus]|uniref:hypothetical protein n=1 Tax=Haladaptatus paucihalophilus TaxID=367189 RepID=UPI000A940CAF|nr:hypothetical protein [Haladaptatus paucihalophilus]